MVAGYAAIYLRISKDPEMDGLAIERQRKECRKIASRHKLKVYREYVDQSISAYDRSKKRPGYNAMVADYEAGRFGAIITWEPDRLTRRPEQMDYWLMQAEEKGLTIYTVEGAYDLSTETGRTIAGILAHVSHQEVVIKGKRQSAAYRQRAENGGVPNGPRLYGYTLGAEVVPEEAEVVRGVYRRFLSGVSINAIVRALSGEPREGDPDLPAVPRPSYALAVERNERRRAKGLKEKPLPDPQPWNHAAVTAILRNPRYAGWSVLVPSKERQERGDGNHDSLYMRWRSYIVTDDEGNPVKGGWEPLVSNEDWKAVQEVLDDPRRRTNRYKTERKHLGSGLYLCGVCGKPMHGHGRSRSYYCTGHVTRKMDKVDELVTKTVRARLARPDLADLLVKRDEPRLKEIAEAVGKQRSRIANAEEMRLDGDITKQRFRELKERAEAEIQALESERARLMSGTSASGVVGAADPVAAFDNASLAEKRSVIDALCAVTLKKHPSGDRHFDGSDVVIEWKVE